MAYRPFYDYQLKLQNDPLELAKFRRGGETALESMREHGLPDELLSLLLSESREDRAKLFRYAETELAQTGKATTFAEMLITFTDPEPEGEPQPEPEPATPKPGEPGTKRSG